MATVTMDGSAASVDISLYRGDGFSYLLDFDINLTGYTFEAFAFWGTDEDDTANRLDFTVTNTDLSLGKITISVDDADTDDLPIVTCEWRLRWTPSGGVRSTVMANMFRVLG